MSWMLGAGILLTMTATIAETKFVGRSFDGAGSAAAAVSDASLAFSRMFLPIDSTGQLTGDSAGDQFESALADFRAALTHAGCSQCARLNIYGVDNAALSSALGRSMKLFPADHRPSITTVVTTLPLEGAKIAIDGVGVGDGLGSGAVVSVGITPRQQDLVFVSGMAEKGSMAEASTRTMQAIEKVLAELGGRRGDIRHVKAFLGPMADHRAAASAIQEFFGSQPPPMTMVEWISSLPIEIEVVASLPPMNQGARTTYFNPPGGKVSPVYSRVARIPAGTPVVFTSGLSSRLPGDSAAQLKDVFAQLRDITQECGSDFENLAKATYYVTNADVSASLGKVREQLYNPLRPPAASKATVAGIGVPDLSIALDMIAAGKP